MTMKKTRWTRWAAAVITGAAVMTAAIPAYADTDGAQPSHKSPIEQLVENGSLSQETYDSIENYMKENRPERGDQGSDGRQGFLADAVSDGIITQETADQLETYMKTKMEERKGENDGALNGRVYKGAELWDNMLSEGVITQEEYQTIIAAMPQRPAGQTAAE